jgi:uncharacterized protein YoxC
MSFLLFADPIIETPVGAMISANWFMLGLAGIAVFFLVRTLNKFEKTLETMTITVNELQRKSGIHDLEIQTLKDDYVDGIAKQTADILLERLKNLNK